MTMTDERRTPLDRLEQLGPGDIGAWVRLPDGTVGQVWAKWFGASVWVADGLVYHEVEVARLVLADPPDETGGLW